MKKRVMLFTPGHRKTSLPARFKAGLLLAVLLLFASLLIPGTSGKAQPPDPPPKPPEKPVRKPRNAAPVKPAETAAPAAPINGVPYDPFPRPAASTSEAGAPHTQPKIRTRPGYDLPPEYHEHTRISRLLSSKLYQAKYEELEKQAEEWRQSKEAYCTGEWKLTHFYQSVAQFGKDDPGDDVVASLRKWVATRPDSITANVALAQGLVDYAWAARGTGSGSSLSPEQREVFQERLQEARLVLREAKKLDAKCPHWWAVAQSVALGQGWDRQTYYGLYKEAITFEPSYYLYYFNRTSYLLARWYGRYGEPEEFAVEAADYLANKKGQEEGDMLYAWIYWTLDRLHASEIDYTLPNVSSERLDRGFQALLKRYPDNVAVKSQWAQHVALTWTKENKEQRKALAQKLVTEINYRVDLWAFHNIDEFNAMYRKVFHD